MNRVFRHCGPLSWSNLVARTRSSPFMLALDTSVAVPVLLTDVLSTNGPSLDFIVGHTGPPGKFYGSDAALTLLNTIRAGGPSARIIMGDDSSDENKKHFERFCARLHAGDLVCFRSIIAQGSD